MKLSDLSIAPGYRITSALPLISLTILLLVSVNLQLKAEPYSFTTITHGQGNDGDTSDLIIPEKKANLTLHDAVNLTLLRNPELAAFAREMRALEGATLQAGLLRNPEF